MAPITGFNPNINGFNPHLGGQSVPEQRLAGGGSNAFGAVGGFQPPAVTSATNDLHSPNNPNNAAGAVAGININQPMPRDGDGTRLLFNA